MNEPKQKFVFIEETSSRSRDEVCEKQINDFIRDNPEWKITQIHLELANHRCFSGFILAEKREA